MFQKVKSARQLLRDLVVHPILFLIIVFGNSSILVNLTTFYEKQNKTCFSNNKYRALTSKYPQFLDLYYLPTVAYDDGWCFINANPIPIEPR